MDSSTKTLSTAIASALRRRRGNEVLFSLVQRLPKEQERGGEEAERTVSKQTWLRFTVLFQRELTQRQSESSTKEKIATSIASLCVPIEEKRHIPRCDVGLLCSETFFACLAESACLALGRSFCVFNPDDPAQRREQLLRQRSPRLLLSDSMIESLLTSAECDVDINIKEDDSEIAIAADVPDTEIAYFVYTSGSTGEPKCIAASRANLLAYATNFAFNPCGLHATDHSRFLTLSTPFFDPSIGDMITVLLGAHTCLVAIPRMTIMNGELGALLSRIAPTHVVSTPAVWGTVSAHTCRLPATPMRVFLGGEKMPQRVVDEWAALVELYNIYGVTEVTVYQSVQRVWPGTLAREITCGKSDSGTRIDIDTESCTNSTLTGREEEGEGTNERADPDGLAWGEVVLYGPQVCLGYVPNEDSAMTTKTGSSVFGLCQVSGDRFFRTGDIGAWTHSGFLILRGRRDWQIKVNGQRVALEEVEHAVRSTLGKALSQCCCCVYRGRDGSVEAAKQFIGIACELDCADGDAQGTAFKDRAGGIECAVRRVVELFLPAFMLPQHWMLFPSGQHIPQTATGKLNRKAVTLAIEAERANCCEDDNLGEESSEELYQLVAAAWRDAFGVRINARTNFFHAGGDSLGALKLTRSVYLAVGGSDADIDEHGSLPPPFQPHILLCNPRFEDYVAAVRREMSKYPHKQDACSKVRERHPHREEELTAKPSTAGDALLDVVATGNGHLVSLLLEHRLYSVDGDYTRANRCTTPLHVAVGMHNLPMIELLLNYQCKVTCVTKDGVTPVHLAAASCAEALEVLLARGGAPALRCRDARQQSLLHFAGRAGNVAAVRSLLFVHHLDVRTRDKWQRSPAHWAALNGHTEVLKVMCEHAVMQAQTAMEEEEGRGMTSLARGEGTKFRRGSGIARYNRLAKKKTHLTYESLGEIARRMCPGNEEMHQLCDTLSAVIEV